MIFPSLDTLRLAKRNSNPIRTDSYQSSQSHYTTKSSHFRPTPIDTKFVTRNRKPIPDHQGYHKRRHASLRSELKSQPSYGSLVKRDPFVRLGHSVAASFSGSLGTFSRPALPWLTQSQVPARTHRRSHSESSFGTDFYVEPTPRDPNPSYPSVSHRAYPAIEHELTPADSLSNWSLDKITRSPSSKPPVPLIPLQHRHFRTMPPPVINYPSEPESDYDSPAPKNTFPIHPAHKTSLRSRRRAEAEFSPGDDYGVEDEDLVPSLPREIFGFGNNRSMNNVGGKMKVDKMLGLETDAKLCSLFMISGVGPVSCLSLHTHIGTQLKFIDRRG